jgi:zinc transport system ATP-binding protein
LICKDLTLGYDGKPVVSGISFSVNAGDYLCIVGENGCGKSTLMKTLLGLKKQMFGQIVIENGLKQNDIGYLPQQTAAQKDFPASAMEVVRSGCLNRCGLRPFYTKAQKHIAQTNMEKLGVAAIANRCYRELSGGQRQRTLLARALCAAHKILLLDEPAAGLDQKAAVDMYELIAKLNGEGATIIVISHDYAACVKYATHILQLCEPLFFGSKEEYIKSKNRRICAESESGKAV